MDSELIAKDALPNRHEKLSQIRILIADSDPELGELTGNCLRAMGFTNITHADNGEDVVAMHSQMPFDFILADAKFGEENDLDFLRQIRNSRNTDICLVPVILMSGMPNKLAVLAARDAGANYFFAKPLNLPTLVQHFRSIIETPRLFISTPTFKGPDRRYRKSKVAKETRTNDAFKLNAMTMNKHAFAIADQSAPCLIKPDYRLKRCVGFGTALDRVFSREAMHAGQRVFLAAEDQFLKWLARDCRTIREHIKNGREGKIPMQNAFRETEKIALSIHSRAGTFGYECAGMIALSLYAFMAESTLTERHAMLVAIRHVEAMELIQGKKLHGNGGALGNQLVQQLSKFSLSAEPAAQDNAPLPLITEFASQQALLA